MQLEIAAGIADLRFDRGLQTFPEILSAYLDYNPKVAQPEKKVVANGPLSPADIIYAAGALPYDFSTHQNLQAIFSGNNSLSQQAVDMLVSSEFNPWYQVMLGAFLYDQNQIPIDLFSTSIGEFDDQLTKSFQLMARARSKAFIDWEVPRHDAPSEALALDFLKKEIKQFILEISAQTGHNTGDHDLSRAVHAGNLLRGDMTEIDKLLAAEVVPLSGLEYYLLQVMLGDFARNPDRLHSQFSLLIDELKRRVENHESAPGIRTSPVRVYIMGDETQELHLYNSIEDAGGVLVGCDFRMPLYYGLVNETEKPVDSLARWIWNMPNNLPLQERIEFELLRIKMQKPDAVILSNVVGSRHLTGIERLVKDSLKDQLGIPVLSIETTLPKENVDKIDYQINALMQMIGG